MNDQDYIFFLEGKLRDKSVPIDTGEVGLNDAEYIGFLEQLCEVSGISTDTEEDDSEEE